MALFDEEYRGIPPWDIGRPQSGITHMVERGEIKEELRGGIANAIGAFLQPTKTASESFRNATFERRTKAMAEAFFDPQWTERVAEIRKLKIGSVSASRAMAQLLNEIESLSQPEQQESQ